MCGAQAWNLLLSFSMFVSPSVSPSVRPSVRLSRRRARCLLFARLSSSAACLRTAGTLAPEPVPPLSLFIQLYYRLFNGQALRQLS